MASRATLGVRRNLSSYLGNGVGGPGAGQGLVVAQRLVDEIAVTSAALTGPPGGSFFGCKGVERPRLDRPPVIVSFGVASAGRSWLRGLTDGR